MNSDAGREGGGRNCSPSAFAQHSRLWVLRFGLPEPCAFARHGRLWLLIFVLFVFVFFRLRCGCPQRLCCQLRGSHSPLVVLLRLMFLRVPLRLMVLRLRLRVFSSSSPLLHFSPCILHTLCTRAINAARSHTCRCECMPMYDFSGETCAMCPNTAVCNH